MESKPLSPWAYFGLKVLYAIPIVGFILLIVFSFAPRNKNFKNFTRSYWCEMLVVIATLAIIFGILYISGNADKIISVVTETLRDFGFRV